MISPNRGISDLDKGQHEPPVLGYAGPVPAPGFESAPRWAIIVVALALPGLSSALIRGMAGLLTMIALWATAIAAFIFFGPVWGEVLFRKPPLKDAGLYPFLFTCLMVELGSVALALRDRRKALDNQQAR
jgi:hypothetical protein